MAYKLATGDERDDGGAGSPAGFGFGVEKDDLPYKVEVWDADAEYVEHVVAISAHPAIGFAAFYAAAQEYPGRRITLRFKSRILSNWTGKSH